MAAHHATSSKAFRRGDFRSDKWQRAALGLMMMVTPLRIITEHEPLRFYWAANLDIYLFSVIIKVSQ